MAIAYVNTTTTANGTPGSVLTIDIPTGTSNGHLMLCGTVHIGSSALGITPRSSWSLINTYSSGTNAWDLNLNVYYRYATSSEPLNYSWDIGGSGVQNGGFITTFSGVDTVSAIEASALKSSTGNVYSSSAISTAANGDWVAFITGIASNNMTYYDSPTGYLGRATVDGAGAANLAIATQLRSTSGAVPTSSWTNDAVAGDNWATSLVVLKILATNTAMATAQESHNNRQRALARMRDPQVFCGWFNRDPGATLLLPATLLPHYDLPKRAKRRVRLGWTDAPRPGNVATPPPPPGGGGGGTPPAPPSQASGSLGPKISIPAPTLTNADQWMRQTAAWMREANQGHLQNTGIITLNAGQTSTVVTDDRVGSNSFIEFMPRTANAAAERRNGTMFVSSQSKQTFTISHANNAQTDRTFVYTILG